MKTLRSRFAVGVLATALALAALAATEGAARSEARQIAPDRADTAALAAPDAGAHARLLLLDETLYPVTYDDVPYSCDAGNCTTQ